MTTKKYFFHLMLLLSVIFVSCSDSEGTIDTDNLPPTEASTVYILNQGSFGVNNSTLARYDLSTQKLYTDFFKTVNGRGLGDTGNDAVVYGSKMYIVMNMSSTVEVVDAKTGKSLKQIPLKTANESPKEPRYAAAFGGKVYVTAFDDTVTRIDTISLAIDGSVNVGRDPEGICIKNNKIYVANSGGLEYVTGNFDKTVSVINLQTFTEEKKIEVGKNPFRIFADSQGDIYVSTRAIFDSSYNKVASASLKRIKAGKDDVETIANIEPADFTLINDKAYIIADDYMQSKVTVYDCINEKVIKDKFISDGTKMSMPFGISVDPYSNDVFLTESDYITPGNVYHFDKDGKLKNLIKAVGMNPYVVTFR